MDKINILKETVNCVYICSSLQNDTLLVYNCNSCDNSFMMEFHEEFNYCPYCGERLIWESVE